METELFLHKSIEHDAPQIIVKRDISSVSSIPKRFFFLEHAFPIIIIITM